MTDDELEAPIPYLLHREDLGELIIPIRTGGHPDDAPTPLDGKGWRTEGLDGRNLVGWAVILTVVALAGVGLVTLVCYFLRAGTPWRW